MSFQGYSESLTARLHLGQRSKPVILGAVFVVILGLVLVGMSLTASSEGMEIQSADGLQEETRSAVEAAEEPASIYVHVAGCVQAPGMYQLSAGARVAEAIQAAGGFTPEAQTESVNLARSVQDGEQVIVASVAQAAPAATAGEVDASAASESGLVNINTADEEELQKVSGIGPSKAAKIVAYRKEHGSFASIEDLTQVSGIGEKTLASVKDEICVS